MTQKTLDAFKGHISSILDLNQSWVLVCRDLQGGGDLMKATQELMERALTRVGHSLTVTDLDVITSALKYCSERKFSLGDRVIKPKGASWRGKVVGFYSTSLTPVGYCVESEREPGSVQIYPEAALERSPP